VTVGPPTKLAFTVQPGNGAAGSSITPAVTVSIEDAQGNVVTTATNQVTMAIGTNPSSATLGGTTQVTAVAGVATFSNLSINNPGTGYTLAASATGLTSATSNAFNAFGAAAKLAFTVQPGNVAAGGSITPAVTVSIEDAQGIVVTTATNQVTMAIGTNPSSATLGGTAQAAAVAGVATFSTLNLNKVGTGYTLTAAATGLTAATSSTFNVTAAAAAKLAFTVQTSSTTAGAAITPAVAVSIEDALGNVVITATNQVTITIGTNPSSGTLSGTTQVSAVAGVATFPTLSINNAGTGYTLTAAATGLTGATSGAFNVTAGAAAKLGFTVQPSNVASGSSITPAVTVTVQDALGNLVIAANNSVSMTIGTNPSSGTLSGTTPVTAVAGVATFSSLSIDNAGTGYTLTASASGLTSASSSAFNVFGTATKLAFTVQPSNVAAGSSINPAVTVSVEDALGSVVTTATNQITIAIGANPSSGTLSGTTPVTAVAGVATFSNLSINNTGTGYTLTASASGLTGVTSNTFNVIVSCGSGSEALLHGQYAFALRGFDASGPVAVGGIFNADGAGNIATLAGVEDINSVAGVQKNLAINSANSSYKVGSDHRGCLTINTTAGTQFFRFSLGAISSGIASTGHIVEFDSTGSNTTGVLRLENPAGFSTSAISGTYAFGASGPDVGGGKFAVVGMLNLSGGSVVTTGANPSVIDADDKGNVDGNGTVYPLNPVALLSGGVYSIGANGRGTLSIVVSGGSGNVTVNMIVYIVSSTEALVLSADPQSLNGLFIGSAMQQSGGPFSTSSLNANSIFYTTGLGNSGATTVSRVSAGILSIPSAGNFSFSGQQNSGATLQVQSATGTYAVAANGRVTLAGGGGGGAPLFYLVSANKGFALVTDGSGGTPHVSSGFL
jgi:hypothetical protein